MNDEIKAIIVFMTLSVIGLSMLVCGVTYIDNTCFDNVPSVVKVDGKIVYEGTSAGFDIESSGANITVTIRGGFLYFFPTAYYTGSNVEVVGKKK